MFKNNAAQYAVSTCSALLLLLALQSTPGKSQPYQQPLPQTQPARMPYQQTAIPEQAGETAMQYQMPKHTPGAAPFAWPAPTQTDLVITTGSSVEGFKVTAYRGLVEGVSVKEPTGIQDLAANLQGMFGGGQISAYGQNCEEARVQAYNNMMRRAHGMGANAVIGVRFDNESMSMGKDNFATAVVCYGTAVVIAPGAK
jgi:uncharacterized protein YbjQ (UPF0145 family)